MRGPVDTSIALTLRGRRGCADRRQHGAGGNHHLAGWQAEEDITYVPVTTFNEQTESKVRRLSRVWRPSSAIR